jgi:TPR repeat protein
MVYAGMCYQRGVGVEKDDVKAVELFQRASNLGDS